MSMWLAVFVEKTNAGWRLLELIRELWKHMRVLWELIMVNCWWLVVAEHCRCCALLPTKDDCGSEHAQNLHAIPVKCPFSAAPENQDTAHLRQYKWVSKSRSGQLNLSSFLSFVLGHGISDACQHPYTTQHTPTLHNIIYNSTLNWEQVLCIVSHGQHCIHYHWLVQLIHTWVLPISCVYKHFHVDWADTHTHVYIHTHVLEVRWLGASPVPSYTVLGN